ncbi:hypothetical protein TcWFU_008677 [Taenia crassiceps]|uniref:Uncharacterized protein n=1 Tax=Taenia crassiceps TaxID=6207 RepID=A0ABR4QE89_9CEST
MDDLKHQSFQPTCPMSCIVSLLRMGDNETINSLLERLVEVRKVGRERVIELTKQRHETVKAQLLQDVDGDTQPSLPPLSFSIPSQISPKDTPLSTEEIKTMTGVLSLTDFLIFQ